MKVNHLPAKAEGVRTIARVSNVMQTAFALDIVCFIFFIIINKFEPF